MQKYTSASEIRGLIENNAQAKKATTSREVLDRWIESRIETARRDGVLLSDRQLFDHRSARRLEVGDYAMFTAETRIEKLADGTRYERPNGQVGKVTATEYDRVARSSVITWRPLPDPVAKDQLIVELQVRSESPGYFALTRLLDPEVDAYSFGEAQSDTA